MKTSRGWFLRMLPGLIVLAQASCAGPQPGATDTKAAPVRSTSAPSHFEKTACRFGVPYDVVAECGDLVVPEDYSRLDGKTIRLHVAIFRSPSDHPQPDPVIYLHGGPGGGANAGLSVLANVLDRDLIIYDQRGTGHSQPRLDCPSMAEKYIESLAQNQRISLAGWEAGHLDACKRDLEKRGVNLAAYTTQANAADLHALINVLGYRQVNLLGGSYGTYLALSYLRDYGSQGLIRSAVLDAINPPQVDLALDRGRNAQAAWSAIFSACEGQPVCRAAYPDLENRLYRLLERLATEPVVVQKVNPLTGKLQRVVVNDFRFMEALYRSTYRSDWIPKIPALITSVERGDLQLLNSALTNTFDSAMSVDQGIYYALVCANQAGLATRDAIRAGNAALAPSIRAYFESIAPRVFAACQKWPSASPAATKNQPVASDIPTLLLSGTFDPSASPAWARLAVQTLSNGYLYEFPAEAHDTLWANSCAQTLAYGFVRDPVKPSAGCMDHLSGPAFELP